MSVFRTTEIQFNGESYTLTPSMALLSQIEGRGISLMGVASMAADGKPQITLMSQILGTILRSTGAEVTDEQIMQMAYTPGNAGEFLKLWSSIYEAISPEPKEGKKPDAPDGK